jgi:hypothetical protein
MTRTAALLAGTVAAVATAQEPPATTVPLKSVYVTSSQEEITPVVGGEAGVDERVLRGVFKQALNVGLSNVFLVSADDIGGAVRATAQAYGSGRNGRRPVAVTPGDPGGRLWLAAFLGSGSGSPPHWRVTTVERAGRRIRLSTTTNRQGASADVLPHFVWVPLGRLDPGAYTLELYDATRREVELTRTVRVGEKGEG